MNGPREIGQMESSTGLSYNPRIVEAFAAAPGARDQAVTQELAAAMPEPQQLAASFRDLSKALLERALEAELSHHLGYAKGERVPQGQPNHRNGTSLKTISTDGGLLPLEIPRDRLGTFEPLLVPRHRRRFSGLAGRILAMYAQRAGLADVERQLRKLYPSEVSPSLLAEVAQAVLAEVESWRLRPLRPLYTVVYFAVPGLRMNKGLAADSLAMRLALGVLPDGTREILGIWAGPGGKILSWDQALADLGGRGVQDILMAVVDGLMTFPPAIPAESALAKSHSCMVHIIRNFMPRVNTRYLPM